MSWRYFLLLSWFAAAPLQAAQLTLSVGDINAPSFTARDVELTLPLDGTAELRMGSLDAAGRHWNRLRVHCAGFELSTSRLACRGAQLNAARDLPFDFSWDFDNSRLALDLRAAHGERWQVRGDFGAAAWRVDARLHNAQAKRIAGLLPQDWPLPTQGALDGTLALHGNDGGLRRVEGDLRSSGLAFSDASGMHAADKLVAGLKFAAARRGKGWDWHGTLGWPRGELYWQPLYLHGGDTLKASGRLQAGQLQVTQAALDLGGVGGFSLSGSWDTDKNALLACDVHGGNLQLAPLFADYAKPFLGEGMLSASEMAGQGSVHWVYRDGATQVLNVTLDNASLEDGQHRFALRGVSGGIPWRTDARTQAQLSFASGALWGIPLGGSELQLSMKGLAFSARNEKLQVLDGSLAIKGFRIKREDGNWRWSFAGNLTPVSMVALSRALGWPEMHGTLSGDIPRVRYDGHELTVGGTLLFHVFDGTVQMTQLALEDPFGLNPRLTGNLDMRNLDLGQLTRTFSFGSMEGRIDASVQNLELVNWQPVKFDARVASSPGDYRRRISQKAVQNISALGGAGAAAAIQRSFLGFLNDFGYSRIGLSCVLRDGVCAMSGVENRNDGYVIVEGGGIPAITVMGYNRAVGWDELLARLKRVLQDNTQMVVR